MARSSGGRHQSHPKRQHPRRRSLVSPGPPAEARPQPAPPAPEPPQRRSTYVEAVALYERGLEALQRHDYAGAAGVVRIGPAAVPGRKGAARARAALPEHLPAPGDAARKPRRRPIEERLYAATLAINGGRYDEAIAHLRLVRDEDPDNDHALYMLAVAHAQRGEHAEAIAHLERAIALNPENRALARQRPRPRAAARRRGVPGGARRAGRSRVDRRRPFARRVGATAPRLRSARPSRDALRSDDN